MEHISSLEQLDEIMSNLHDCPFDLERATFDVDAKTWTGIFLRPLWEDPRAEHWGFPLLFVRSRLPVTEASLTVAGVSAVQIIDDQGIGTYDFNELERAPDGVRLCFNQALRIDLNLAGSIDATYDEKLLPGVRATYRQFLLVQSGPKIEQVMEAD